MICIIPQHALSVRLPRKPFLDICGKPLIAWAVIQAITAKCIDEVYVSTESQEIADIVEPLGAKVIWRPQWLQDKSFAANVPIKHAMEEIGIADKHVPFLSRVATALLVKPGDIDRMYETFTQSEELPLGMLKQVILGAEVSEQVVYERMRKHASYPMCAGVYTNKIGNAVATIGAMNMMYADGFYDHDERIRWYFGNGPTRDLDLDRHGYFIGHILGHGLLYYVPCDQWQAFDIDDEQGLAITRLFMQHYILENRGAEVYYEYAEQNKERV